MTRGDLTKYVAAVVLLVAAFVSVAIVVRRHGVGDGSASEPTEETTYQQASAEHQSNAPATGEDAPRERALATAADGEPSGDAKEGPGALSGRRSLWQCLRGRSVPVQGRQPDQVQAGGSEPGVPSARPSAEAQPAVQANTEYTAAAENAASDVPLSDSSDPASTNGTTAHPTPVEQVVFRFYELSNQWAFTRDVPADAWARIWDELVGAIERYPDDKGVPDAIYALSQMVSDRKDPDLKRCLLESAIFHPRAHPTLQIMVLPELIPYCDPVRQFCLWSWRNELILALPNEPRGEGLPSLRDSWMREYPVGVKVKAYLAEWFLSEGISLDSPELPERDRGKKPSDHYRELLDLIPQIRAAPPPGVNCDELEAETLVDLGLALMQETRLEHTTVIRPADGGPPQYITYEPLPANEQAANVLREARLRFPEYARRSSFALAEARARDPSEGLLYVRTLEEWEKTFGSQPYLSRAIAAGYLRLGQGRPFIERFENDILAALGLSGEPVKEPLSAEHSAERPQVDFRQLLDLGRAYTKPDVEDLEKAVGYCELALSLWPHDASGRPQAYRWLIEACQRLGDYEKALRYAEQLVAEHPEGSRWVPSDTELLEELRARVQGASDVDADHSEK